MKRNWNICIVTSIICRLLALVAILAFVFAMVAITNNLNCLWLLFLLLAAEIVPVYNFKSQGDNDVSADE